MVELSTKTEMTRSRDSEARTAGLLGMLPGKVTTAFQQMEVAEEEIRGMSELHPSMARKLNEAFLALQPTKYLKNWERLYRPHVVELLGRVMERGDLRDPTAAEMLGVLAEASLVAPPASQAAALYFRLFQELFSGKAEEIWKTGGEASCVTRGEYGRYPGDVEELRETLRKKMRREIGATVLGRGRS